MPIVIKITHVQRFIILWILAMWCRLVFAEAEVAATATAAATEATGHNGAHNEQCLVNERKGEYNIQNRVDHVDIDAICMTVGHTLQAGDVTTK